MLLYLFLFFIKQPYLKEQVFYPNSPNHCHLCRYTSVQVKNTKYHWSYCKKKVIVGIKLLIIVEFQIIHKVSKVLVFEFVKMFLTLSKRKSLIGGLSTQL